ncbi:holin [Mycobacterium phage Redno2]|uniref:holin n=1 Tax=Mycobacterium phage Redno2 TaxID=1340709 RepID=UPI000387A97C|nr:holin [Mycobacterium phage Redno2]AGS82347.1 holin [Mycobacterium phage Redno2]AXQ62458.1 holin [Mycobacterium phage Zelink]QDP43798.1 holin [Mycobacterium phage Dallas]QPO16652.1 holin [Mycobacterium phage KashFlow]
MNLGKYWKAITAFLSLVVTNLAYRVTNGEEPLPAFDDYKGWALFALTTVAGTFLTWAKGNKGFVEADKVEAPTINSELIVDEFEADTEPIPVAEQAEKPKRRRPVI